MRSDHPLFRLFLAIVLNIALALPAFAAFTDNGDGTVTDSQTGLVWMRCSLGQTWNGTTCTGTAAAYPWAQATALTHTYAGRSDWRLPKIRELKSIADVGKYNPAIDGSAFPATPASGFWSGSPVAGVSGGAWGVGFYHGNDDWGDRNSAFQVRLVRAGQFFSLFNDARPSSDYVDNLNGTVTHTPTGLTWMRCSVGQTWNGTTCTGTANTYAWDQAKALTQTYAGHNDWRLPDLLELKSLVDYTRSRLAINASVFPAASASYFWSGSPFAGYSDYAWSVYFYFGYDSWYGRDFAHPVRLVRAGQSIGNFALTVAQSGTGSGTIGSSPAGINCGSLCTASFTSGTAVTLTATPASGSTFTGWGGACSGTATCTVTMSAARSVSATFSSAGSAATTPATEYYHAGFGHYFVTGSADEAAAIDSGVIKGWARTGQTYSVYAQSGAGLSPVCRFFSTSFAPKSSHFYTPSAAECGSVKTNPNWQFEGNAFYVNEPTGGACPVGSAPLYRIYNNGRSGAPNHRYTTCTSIRDNMISRGWVSEGVAMCVPGGSANCATDNSGGGVDYNAAPTPADPDPAALHRGLLVAACCA